MYLTYVSELNHFWVAVTLSRYTTELRLSVLGSHVFFVGKYDPVCCELMGTGARLKAVAEM